MWNHLIVLIMISITPSFKVQTMFEQSKERVRQWRIQDLNIVIFQQEGLRNIPKANIVNLGKVKNIFQNLVILCYFFRPPGFDTTETDSVCATADKTSYTPDILNWRDENINLLHIVCRDKILK